MATTKTGVKITVDTSDIDVKFLKSVDQLNAGLTKTQKRLGLVYNEQGLLTNALGQTVEGLTTSQIKLGQYVDELGRVRTFQDGYAEGLSKTQLALGMYADELGNIYNATGEMIGQTDKAAKALEKEAAQAAQAAQAAKELNDGAQGTTQTLGEVGEQLEGALGKLKGIGGAVKDVGGALGGGELEKIGKFGESIGQSIKKAKKIKGAANDVKNLVDQMGGATRGAKTLSRELEGIGKAAAYIYIAVEAYKLLNKCMEIERPKGFDENIEYFRELESRAARAGDKIRSLSDALNAGAFSAYRSEIGSTIEELERLRDTGLSFEQQKTVDKSWFGITAEINKALYQIENLLASGNVGEEEKAIYAQIDQFVSGVVDSQKSQASRLLDQANEIMRVAGYVTDAAQYEQLYSAAEKLRQQAIETQEKELEEAKQSRLKAAGMLEYLDAAEKSQAKTAPTIEEFNATLEEWKERVQEGNATQEQLNASLAAKQKEIATQLAETYGVGSLDFTPAEVDPEAKNQLETALKEGAISLDQYREEIDQLRKAAEKAKDDNAEADLKARFEAGEISAEQYSALLASLKKKRAAQLEKELAEETDAAIVAERWREALEAGRIAQADYNDKIKSLDDAAAQKLEEERATLQNQLGVSFEPPTDITPLESYSASVASLDEAFKNGIVNQEEYNNALEQLKNKAREEFPTLEALNQPDAAATIQEFREGAGEILKGEEISKELEQSLATAQKNIDQLTANGGTLTAESLEALRQYNDSIKQAADAYEKGVLDKEERDALIGEASSALADSLEKQRQEVEASAAKEKEARERDKEKKRSELGIDSLLEEMKSPLDKYRETMDKIAEAAKNGTINEKEQRLLETKAHEDYWTRMDELSATAQRGAEKLDKMELGKSSAKGSESLYLAMVKQSQNGFQNKIQATTARIAEYQSQSLREAQYMNQYLSVIAENGGLEVYRG